VERIDITDTGSGYTSTPTISFSGGGGSGLAGTVIRVNDRVTAVQITNHGSGYTSAPTISFSGGGGSGATAVAVLPVIGSENIIVANNIIYDDTDTPTMEFGVALSGTVKNVVIEGNDMGRCVYNTSAIKNYSFASTEKIYIGRNIGVINEQGGSATIASGDTYVTVNHTLCRTPNKYEIAIFPDAATTSDYGKVWVSNITSTTFRINCSADPGASGLTLQWMAKFDVFDV
jgi:hypothetical protein